MKGSKGSEGGRRGAKRAKGSEHYKYLRTVKRLHLSFDLCTGNIYVKMVQGPKGSEGGRSASPPSLP